MFYLIDSGKTRRSDVRQEFDTWREVRDEVIAILESYALATSQGRQTAKRKSLIADLYSEADDFRVGIVRVHGNESYSTTIGNQYIAVGKVNTAGAPVLEEIKHRRDFHHRWSVDAAGRPVVYRITRLDRRDNDKIVAVHFRAVGPDGRATGMASWATPGYFLSSTIGSWVA